MTAKQTTTSERTVMSEPTTTRKQTGWPRPGMARLPKERAASRAVVHALRSRVACGLLAAVVALAGAGVAHAASDGCVALRRLSDAALRDVLRDFLSATPSSFNMCLTRLAMVRIELLPSEAFDDDIAFGPALRRFGEANAVEGVHDETFKQKLVAALDGQIEKNVEVGRMSHDPLADSGMDEAMLHAAAVRGGAVPETMRPEGADVPVGSTTGLGVANDAPGTDAPRVAALLPEVATPAADAPSPFSLDAPRLRAPHEWLPPSNPKTRAERGAAPAISRAGCLSVGDHPDSDVKRNAFHLAQPYLCMTRHAVDEPAGTTWRFTLVKNLQAPQGPVWYLPHDNEDASFDAAVHAINAYGGAFLALEAGENRNFAGVDPNRNFGRSRETIGACKIARPTPAYSEFVMAHFADRDDVLTLHNNTNGGGVTVNVNNDKETGLPALVDQGFGDPDNLVYVADRERWREGNATGRLVQNLRRSGLNVVHERVRVANNDCSLSNYVALHFPEKRYFNVEAEHGRAREQKRMVDAVMAVLGRSPLAPGAAAAR